MEEEGDMHPNFIDLGLSPIMLDLCEYITVKKKDETQEESWDNALQAMELKDTFTWLHNLEDTFPDKFK